MADDKKPTSPGFSEVIDSVHKASSDELAALARIERKLTGQKSGAVNVSASDEVRAGAPRSVRLASERKKAQEKDRKKAIKNQVNNKHQSDLNVTNNSKDKSRLNVINLSDKNQSSGKDSTVNIIIKDESANSRTNNRNSTIPEQTKNRNLSSEDKARRDALAQLKSPNRPAATANTEAKGRTRDENGRYTSRDKARENQAARQQGESDRERDASDKKREALFTRIGKMLSNASDPMDADATNAAGVAGGGSFWKAGHEVYSMAKGTVAGGVSGAQKMREFMGGKDGEEDQKKPGLLKRAFSRGSGGKRNSASVIAANAQREQAKATEQQTSAIKEGDKVIADKLDELIKERHGSKSGGLWGLLGAAAMGQLGKKLLAGILGGLGAKTLADRLRGGVGGSRRKRKPGGFADDCGCDVDLPGGGDTKRKPTRKERREARRRAGKKGLFSRFGKKAVVAGGVAAAGAAAADAVIDAADGAKDAGKLASKVTATEAGSAAAAAAGTGAAAAAGKVAAAKTAGAAGEKVAVKAAEKAGTKLATKAAMGATLRTIPVVGQVIGAGIDGVMGWRDKEGQQSAFNIREDQQATKRQKAEYATANILDMGGLVSGGAGLLAKGAKALGFDGAAKKLTFTTDDIARSIDGTVTSAKSVVRGATDYIGLTKAQNQQEKNEDVRTQTLVSAIKDGAKNTVDAIKAALNTGIATVSNTASGVAENAGGSVKRFVAGFTQPTTDDLSPNLNVGGANARNRNFRNNNFGNLVYVGQEGARLENANANGERRFARYDTPEEGMRGLGNQLMSYYNGTSAAAKYQKLQSIDQIISMYAPESENNTKAYKASLAQQLGVGVGDKLDLKNPQVMTSMIRAISTVEGGNPQVTDDFIKTALGQYTQGSNGKGKWVGQFNDATLKIVNEKRQALGQDLLSKDAQFSGIATANGKAVDPVKAADVTPVTPPVRAAEPEQHAQTAKKHHAGTITENGVTYRPADIPLAQGTGAGQAVAGAEGLRHQTGDVNSAAAPAQSRPLAASEGVKFRAAHLPGQDTAVGKWLSSHNIGTQIQNAEGLRHQVAPGTAAKESATARPTMAIPAKIPTVTDMASNHVQPTVHVTNEQSFPKEVKATFEKIAKSLERIEGHTKDTAEKSGDASPKANSPQPAPRSSTPLSINDPLMANVAND